MSHKSYKSRQFSLVRELMQTRVVMMEGNALHAYRTQLLQNFNQHILSSDLSEDLIPTERHYMLCYQKEVTVPSASQAATVPSASQAATVPSASQATTVPSASPEGNYHPSGILFFDECNNLIEETADGETVVAHAPKENEERILVLELCGPVTRSGGMCSYGSIDFRDMLLGYADDSSVKGFVLVTDTPGGTAFALHDFEQGMRAWNEAGKFSVQWIDGMSCSAGVALGSQCQQVVAYNDHDVIGCIGAMIAGWATADGTVDSDGNRFIDVTASQTPDKNGEFRAAAAGDYEALQKEVDACASEFLRILDEHRPQIPAEQRTGRTYEAKDVVGTLIDGIASFEDACHYALTGEAVWQSAAAPSASPEGEDPDIIEPEPKDPENDDPEPDRDPQGEPDASTTVPSVSPEGPTQQTILKPKDMTLLQKIAHALGIKDEAEVPAEEQTVETPANEQPAAPAEESVNENPNTAPSAPEATAPEATAPESPESTAPAAPEATAPAAPSVPALPSLEERLADVHKQLQEQVDVNAALAEANAAALAKKDEEIDALNATIAEHVATIDAKSSDNATLTARIAELEAQVNEQVTLLTECKAELESKEASITDLNSKINDLKEENDLLKAVGAQPKTPAPAPSNIPSEEADETPDEFTPGNMTAQELIAIQQKKSASRNRKKKA